MSAQPDPPTLLSASLLVDSLRSTAEILRKRQDEPFEHDTLARLLEEAADELMILYGDVLKNQLGYLGELLKTFKTGEQTDD